MARNEYVEVRGRNFAFVQLVENMPENWQHIVESKMLPVAYIIHDKDVYTEEDEAKDPEHVAGTPKKPHVHFFVYFNGKRTPSGVVNLFWELGILYAERVECKNAYLAYMLHLRQEGKHRYGYDELVVLNGLKVNFADLNNTTFADVMEFADEYHVYSFARLCVLAKEIDPPIFRYVTAHHALVLSYFASREQEQMEAKAC